MSPTNHHTIKNQKTKKKNFKFQNASKLKNNESKLKISCKKTSHNKGKKEKKNKHQKKFAL